MTLKKEDIRKNILKSRKYMENPEEWLNKLDLWIIEDNKNYLPIEVAYLLWVGTETVRTRIDSGKIKFNWYAEKRSRKTVRWSEIKKML